MNAKQKLHQIKLQQWADRFRDQASSGLTVKAWCAENNITIHTYNYWKHQLKQEYLDSALSDDHEIVPLTMNHPLTTASLNLPLQPLSRDSHNSGGTISISAGDIVLHVGSSVSAEHLLRILKAVRHA